MIIVIALKKLDRNTKRSIKSFYSMLEFKKSQIKKSIPELGDADVLLFELDISMIFNVRNNIIYKYLKSQDLTSIKVVWVYENTRYKNLINDVNVFLRKFPLLQHKNIDEALEIQEERERDIKSKFEPEPEEDHEISFEKLQDVLTELITDYKHQQQKHQQTIKDYVEQLNKLKDENEKLHEELKKIDVKQQLEEVGLEAKEEPDEPEKHDLIVKGKKIFVNSNIKGVVETVQFKNTLDRRKKMVDLKMKYC